MVEKISGNPIPGATINITVTQPDGTTVPLSTTTDTTGAFAISQSFTQIGSYPTVAVFAGDAAHNPGSASGTFSIAAPALLDVTLTLNIAA